LHGNVCALLVETVATGHNELLINIDTIKASIHDIPSERPIQFTDIAEEYELLWKIRKGLFPSVGAMRKAGTTVIIEDVAFPLNGLAAATGDLQNLLKKYGYNEAVIFGHALEGNLHYVFTQDFNKAEEIDRYGKLIAEISDMVVNKYDGSLKAEHGTGRNMAPFVEMEWGKEAYQLMKDIKYIFDPMNILNPGVILNNDPHVHLRNLKPIPAASELTDKCTECGFCEPSCVSADMTLTPRQRIVVHREIISLNKRGNEPHIAASLAKSFPYAADKTCATDGLCAPSCPVNIDTGKLIKHIRSEQVVSGQRRAVWLADRMDLVTTAARTVLSMAGFFHRLLGTTLMSGISAGLRNISGKNIPAWNPYMPNASQKIRTDSVKKPDSSRTVVYFPSCINRTMGISRDHKEEKQLSEKMTHLLHKGGFNIIYPENLNNLCCGMAFSSKGYAPAGEKKSKELETMLIKASMHGKYPILCDMSPCLYTMKENMKSNLNLLEPVEFILEYLLPHLTIKQTDETITVFSVCSRKRSFAIRNK